MKEISFKGLDGKEYKRVCLNEAQKEYDDGKVVVLCPNKLRPGSPWNPEGYVTKENSEHKPFHRVVGMFKYYNCNSETGYYPMYFVSVNESK